eukprot:9207691-Pyramimonas_sp.AAC.1
MAGPTVVRECAAPRQWRCEPAGYAYELKLEAHLAAAARASSAAGAGAEGYVRVRVTWAPQRALELARMLEAEVATIASWMEEEVQQHIKVSEPLS